MTKEELVRHVKDSFWLDLAYDEEDRNILAEKGLKLLVQEAEGQRSIALLPVGEDSSRWFDHFKRLKVVRVLDGLDLNEASRDYADSNVESAVGQFPQDKFEVVRDRAMQCRTNLDTITWRCSAAIDRIVAYYNSKSEAEESERCTWATLLALYHSELCASASEEVSFGWARRQAFVLKKEAVGLRVFRWIANHNASRGYNHLKNPLSGVKGLDFDVDAFKCEELSKELEDGPEKENKENIDMLYRLLYMPAILTLAQSLGDLQRHSERRYYLNKGMTIAAELSTDYWKRFLSLQLSLTEIDTGLAAQESHDSGSQSQVTTEIIPPRTKSLSKLEENQRAELEMRTDFGRRLPLVEATLESWRKTTAWLFLWHSAETHAFHAGLRATAEFLVDLLKLAKKSAKRNAAKGSSSEREVMEIAIKFLIETRRFMAFLISGSGLSANESKSVRCLLDDTAPRELTDLHEIWRSGSRLLGCLNTLNEVFDILGGSHHSQEMEELRGWRGNLGKALNWTKPKGASNSVEHQFRSEIEHLKLFPYSTPTTRSCCQSKESVNCHDDCVQNAMGNTITNPQVAKYDTYKRAMYSQQRRFLDYLKFRTAQYRNYRAGEPPVKSPDFELISLRRWNSFSPNLGSRAAASVGGGYLVRLWHRDRYLGIAVDPGYNFLENLFNEGFTIADIDIIVVTHAHPDHTENLTNLFTLLFERNKRMADEEKQDESTEIPAPIDHRVFLLVTEGVFERYESMLRETKTYVRDVVVLKAAGWPGSGASSAAVRVSVCSDKQSSCCIELNSNTDQAFKGEECAAVIQAKRAWHDDQTEHDSIGIVVTYWGESKQPKLIGILGDSKYHEELYRDYSDCSVLIAHLGSLISKSYYRSTEENRHPKPEDYEKMIKEEAHLYLPGLTRLICDLKNRNGNKNFPLLVLSEFGEELRGGLRKDLAKRLAYGVQKERLPIVPADVGLRIDIEERRIFCSVCHNYFAWEVITAESVLPHEEALAFVCEDCRLLRAGELARLLEDWCTTGRPVVPLHKTERGSTGSP